ncbi:hypothetical protein BaRGS_00028121 [Batillaria attramentaria]|uniref:Cystatin domain-containing protein n=1 Tax=Batillaria attramentaria TaxID=370345 RepID=A0ABD0K039_9CAEN
MATEYEVLTYKHMHTHWLCLYKLHIKVKTKNNIPDFCLQDEFCDVAVVSKPWLKGADRLTLSGLPVCSLVPPPAAANSKGHNSTALGSGTTPSLVGAQRPVPTIDLPVDVIVALNYAVQEVNRRSNNLYAFTLTSLDGVEATQQIVSGKLYRFKGVPLQETRCGKMASFTATSRSQCTPVQNGQTMVCDLTVWWQAWRKPKYTLEDFNSDSCHMTQNPPPPQ